MYQFTTAADSIEPIVHIQFLSNKGAYNGNNWDLPMSTILKMDARGRVTLPRALRIALKISSGDRVTFSQSGYGTVILSPKGKPVSENRVGESAIELLVTNR